MANKVNTKLLSMAGQGGSAFGVLLMELMKERNDIMVLSADMSTPAGLDKFKAAYPDNFMNVGIAEQNMIGIAAGMASEGYKVICVAQACFITMRCFEQIRQYAGYMKFPMVLVGIGSGLSLQYMGNTHYSIEDISLMRMVPGMEVMAPCDSLEAIKVLEYAINSTNASYIRLFGGTNIPVVHAVDYEFNNSKPIELREGKDIAILAIGSMVRQALDVAENISANSIDCEVVGVPYISVPFSAIEKSIIGKKLVLTLEEHRVTGGFGSYINETLIKNKCNVSLLKIGIDDDLFPHPGSYPYLLKQCGLDVESITGRILSSLK